MLELRLLQRDGGGRVLRLLDRRAGRVVLLVPDEQTNGKGLLVGGPGLIRQLPGEVYNINIDTNNTYYYVHYYCNMQ